MIKRLPFPQHGTTPLSRYPAKAQGWNTPPISRTSSPAGPQPRPATPPNSSNAVWVCNICSFSNTIPANFDPNTSNSNTPLLPCQACGINPSFAHVLKAAIAHAARRQSSSGPAQTVEKAFPQLVSQFSKSDSCTQQRDFDGSTSMPRLSFQ